MLTIVRGRTFSFDATIYDTYVAEGDPGNVPTNHSGWTIRSQIRKKIGNVLVANLNVTFPVPTAGTVAIRHDRDFTRSLPVGDYWWDIVATDPSGIDHDYLEPEPIAVHDHPTDPANATYDFVPGGGGAVYHTHSISDITGLQALLDDRLPPDGGSIARYLRGDNTWQLLNKAAVGLGNVENVTLSSWGGSPAIVQVGTISQGVWQGTRIAPAYLGDGTADATTFLRGDGTWQTVSGGGGATAYIDLTDAASVNLPSINTALAASLAGKAATSHTHTASQISDSTVTGRALLTAATQSDARTTGLGSGATGDALFQAATPAAARTTLELGEAVIRKITTADVSRNNTGTGATYTNDATLQSFAVDANSWYLVEFALLFTCTVNSGIKTQLLHPALATASAFSGRVFSSSSPTDAVANTSTVTTLHSVTAARTVAPISGYCRIRIGATGGTIALQWAQNAASADNTTLLAGSLMTVTKI